MKKTPPKIREYVRDDEKAPAPKSRFTQYEERKAKLTIRDGKLPAVMPTNRQIFKGERGCLCGCGNITRSFFVRGHVRKFHAALAEIARGESTPDDLMTEEMVKRLGPWVPEGKGLVPTKSYTQYYD